MAKWEDYVIGDTGVLRNKLGINNGIKLKEKENEIVVSKLAYLYIHRMKGSFDKEHLCRIHKFLFDEIYDFAGMYREVNIYKEPPEFSAYDKIEDDLTNVFNRIKNNKVNFCNKFDIAEYIGNLYYELIMIHPFREGNGRAIREFIRQFVLEKFPNYELDYTKINKEHFKIGIIDKQHFPLLLAFEIYNGLVEVENNKKKDKVYVL